MPMKHYLSKNRLYNMK